MTGELTVGGTKQTRSRAATYKRISLLKKIQKSWEVTLRLFKSSNELATAMFNSLKEIKEKLTKVTVSRVNSYSVLEHVLTIKFPAKHMLYGFKCKSLYWIIS